jgi:hypothetical protein
MKRVKKKVQKKVSMQKTLEKVYNPENSKFIKFFACNLIRTFFQSHLNKYRISIKLCFLPPFLNLCKKKVTGPISTYSKF